MKLALLFLIVSISAMAQLHRHAKLPKELKEVSGLEQLNDSLLVAINDGGNSAHLYILSLAGEIQRDVATNQRNIDWEDLTIDRQKGILYVGDFGNNLNKRRSLNIYAVSIDSILTMDSVILNPIAYRYPDQIEFPPPAENLFYDCEAMVYHDELLWIFTKSNAKPYIGKSLVYTINPESHAIRSHGAIQLGNDGYFKNSITGATSTDTQLFLLTYSGIYTFLWNDLSQIAGYDSFGMLTQKESICINLHGGFWLADERSPLLVGQNLYLWKQ